MDTNNNTPIQGDDLNVQTPVEGQTEEQKPVVEGEQVTAEEGDKLSETEQAPEGTVA